MKNHTISNGLCTANITVNRGRVKMHGSSVYLKDGQNFEIELFNPHETSVLAKIKINGNFISSSGIILKPGQRVYIERYLDDNKKFLFETYEVEKSTEVENATRNNGKVEIFFHREELPTQYWYNNFTPTVRTYVSNPTITITPGYPTTPIYFGNTDLTITCASTSTGTSGVNYCATATAGSLDGTCITTNSVYTSASYEAPVQLISETLETGRVEMGGKSDQVFSDGYGNFASFASETASIRLLPESQKPAEAKDLRTYCTECGTKMKKTSWKFCPNCGNKLS